jgi:hypothetical protein
VSQPAERSDGEHLSARHPLSGKPRAAFAIITGALVLAGWGVLIASSFLATSESSNRFFADVLLGLVAVCAIASLWAWLRIGIVTAVAAVVYAAAWYYIGWSLSYSIGDAIHYALAAAFFLAPIVVGVSGLFAGRQRSRQVV